MKLPPDWDKPSEGNDILCQRFQADYYKKGSVGLPYRLFVPDSKEDVPLVVYLHGADAVGEDNLLHLSMHDIGTTLAKEGWQNSHPCFILAPQYRHSMHWSVPEVSGCVMSLIRKTLIRFPNIDKGRIYIYGYSAGGVGALRMLKEHPGCFAGGISICGATSGERIDYFKKMPLWLVHADDDEIVKASYSEGMSGELWHFGSRDLYIFLQEVAKDLRYTQFPAGYMKRVYGVNPHCSWVAVSDPKNIQFFEWLFSQSRKNVSN